ncbi:MAG: flagellar basal body P-ring formation chaperone FlgA [Alphaproteobacteria bacterium]
MTPFRIFRLIALLLVFVAPAPGFSAELVLRTDVLAKGGLVTVGDFFADAGPVSERPLFRAPRRGASGVVQTYRLVDALNALGIAWRPPAGLREIRVHRVSETLDKNTIAKAIARQIGLDRPAFAGAGEIDIRLDQSARAIIIDGAREAAVSVVSLDIFDARRSFRADIKITGATGRGATVRRTVRGRFAVTLPVPVLVRSLRRGDIITQVDLVTRRQPATARTKIIVDAARIIGKSARRSLPAGQPLRPGDIQTPRVVRKNQLVTIEFRAPGMVVTTRGRALREGGVGDAVPVINVRSNKIIDAVIKAPGLVSVSPQPLITVASR